MTQITQKASWIMQGAAPCKSDTSSESIRNEAFAPWVGFRVVGSTSFDIGFLSFCTGYSYKTYICNSGRGS